MLGDRVRHLFEANGTPAGLLREAKNWLLARLSQINPEFAQYYPMARILRFTMRGLRTTNKELVW